MQPHAQEVHEIDHWHLRVGNTMKHPSQDYLFSWGFQTLYSPPSSSPADLAEGADFAFAADCGANMDGGRVGVKLFEERSRAMLKASQ